MKTQQQQHAKELYLQAGLNKSEIAGKLDVSRRTIYNWSIEGDWENLRKSARHMPSILAEKIYYLIGHLTDNILQRDPCYNSITKAEVDMLSKLTNTVNKLRKGSTVNENMETFTHLLERIKRTDATLADQLVPHVTDYIEARRGISETDFLLHVHNADGTLPTLTEDLLEKWADEEDAAALLQEIEEQKKQAQQSAAAHPDSTAIASGHEAPHTTAPASTPLTESERERMQQDLERILGTSTLQSLHRQTAIHTPHQKAA